MGAGKYRHYVTLEQFADGGRSASGARTGAWAAVGNAWADIEPSSPQRLAGAKEAVMDGATTAVDVVAISMRPYPGLAADSWRLRCDGRLYDIKAVRPTNKGDEVTVIATVGAAGA